MDGVVIGIIIGVIIVIIIVVIIVVICRNKKKKEIKIRDSTLPILAQEEQDDYKENLIQNHDENDNIIDVKEVKK